MSPIELLIEDTNTSNNNSNRKEGSIINSSIQINVVNNINNSSLIDNQKLLSSPSLLNNLQEKNSKANNLLRMSSHESSAKQSSLLTISNDDRNGGGGCDSGENDGGGSSNEESKNNLEIGNNDNTLTHVIENNSTNQNLNNHILIYERSQSPKVEKEETHSIYDENVSSSSMSSTSSMSPMSDSASSQSKTNNNYVNENDKNCIEDVKQEKIDEKSDQNFEETNNDETRPDENYEDDCSENNEVESALNNETACSNSINNKTLITSPPNSLALHTNLNNVMLSDVNSMIENPINYFEPVPYTTNINPNHQTAFLSASTSNSPSIQHANNPYNMMPIPSHNLSQSHLHHPPVQTYIYPSTTQFPSHLSPAPYMNYSGYTAAPQQYVVHHVPSMQQQTTSNRPQSIPAPSELASSSSSASTPTPKQTVAPSSSSSSSSSSNVTTANQTVNNIGANSSTIFVHIDSGHAFRVQMGDEIREIIGPATVKMVSNDGSQPVPIQLTSPSPGQLVQQIIDENGILTHLILSSHQQNINTPASLMNLQSPELNNNLSKSGSTNSIQSNSSSSPNKSNSNQINGNSNINSPTSAHPAYYPLAQSNSGLPPTYYPYSIVAPQPFQPIQSQHNSAAVPVLNQLTVLPSYHNLSHQHQQSYYNHNQYISSTNQFSNNLIPSSISPSQSPQPSNLANKQTSPVNSSSFTETNSDNYNNNKNTNCRSAPTNSLNSSIHQSVLNNLVSVSPSSSCSSASATSSISSNSSVSNKSNDEQILNKNQSFNPKSSKKNNDSNNSNYSTIRNNKEQKSFRKYNSSSFNNSLNSHIIDKIFNNSTSTVPSGLINKPFQNYYNKNKERNDSNLESSKTTKTLIYTHSNYSLSKSSNKKQPYHQIIAYNQSNHHNQIHNSFNLHNFQNYNNQLEHQKQYNQASQYTKSQQSYNQVNMDQEKQINESFPKRLSNSYENSDPLVKTNKTVTNDNKNDNKTNENDKTNSGLKNIEFFRKILNRIKKPTVCDVEAQSVLVKLTPIDLEDPEIGLNEAINKINSSSSSTSSSSSSTDNTSPIIFNSEYVLARFENLNYTLELSGETNTFSEVYTGDANEITLKDLRPNSKYFLRVFASLDSNCRGDYTSAVSFQTESSQPDPPTPTKQVGPKRKNEICVKWGSANDNGSKILNYILEAKIYEEASSKSSDTNDESSASEEEKKEENTETVLGKHDFTECYKGPLKQATVKRLKPSTCYVFRVAAENAYGKGEYSKLSVGYTSGCVPNIPEPPYLIDSTISSLNLGWQPSPSVKNLDDLNFELQMLDIEDPNSISHGFLTVYNGSMFSYKVTGLRLYCFYQFRLRAKNEEGYSPWSESVKYATKADVPRPPIKLRYKIQPFPILVIKVSWEAPKENGGSKVQSYCLEMADSLEENFIVIYEGDQLEYSIDQKLKPGFAYKLRVSCSNSIGSSDYSETVSFLTPASLPEKCLPPKVHGKLKANSVQLRWFYPENDGGSQIIYYEVSLNKISENEDNKENENLFWKGDDLSCTINGLLPGRNYQAKLRATNKIGSGQWSEFTEFTSGSGVPDAPVIPVISIKSPNFLIISWNEPTSNGSPIQEYHLEWSPKENLTFSQLYCGSSSRYELKGGLLPATRYFFRVQATNINGSSSFSPIAECLTLASAPSIINSIKVEEVKSDSIKVSWKQPSCNGSPITYYNFDLSDTNTLSNGNSSPTSYTIVYNQDPICEYKIDSLLPDTTYKLRIQAANSIGVGHFSNIIKIKTKALPPLPPNLECVSTSYNSIKLKWNHISSNNNSSESSFVSNLSLNSSSSKLALSDYEIVYNLEMMDANSDDSEFISVYNGPYNFFKVNKLKESATYYFRISASNETGQGKFSDLYKFTTTKSPPINLKSPVISELTFSSCLIEWQPAKLNSANVSDENTDNAVTNDSIEYCLQLQSPKRDSDYKEIYKGDSCSFRIKNLEPGTEYNVRVCAIRIINSESGQTRLCSSFTPHTTLVTPKQNANKLNNIKKNQSDSNLSTSSDADKAGSMTKLCKFSRFLWPSFYLNLNTSKQSNAKLNQLTGQFSSQSNMKIQANNTRYRNSYSNKYSSRRISDPSAINSEHDETITDRSITDQQWAFLFIIILVIIAFLTAYAANSFFTSYYDLSTEL